MKTFPFAILIPLVFATSAFATINISSPSSGEHVSSPFTLYASDSECQSEAVRTIGYSLDNSPDTTLFRDSTTLDTKVSGNGWLAHRACQDVEYQRCCVRCGGRNRRYKRH